ncbi:PepSY domain-containing protein [Oceanobacillus luteolus]|uniref:PepSY domain-containing protein n=1 Tax=Oceanobacillus luteolus TaxID=1274358 RepID=A0ABW4HNK5_9BACI|nr:PepSY domain-containing protein [Oceanobacillus luteolus]MCM3740459.1 PepSY domain-containing protein [Oceanobacillus luteolus]
MKKKTGLIIAALALALILGFSAFQSNADSVGSIIPTGEVKGTKQEKTNQYEDALSVEEVKQIALQKFDGKVTDIELDEDDGRLIYEMELKNEKQEADIDIDAVTGEIVEFDIDEDDDHWDD